jgi:hypothetical protein
MCPSRVQNVHPRVGFTAKCYIRVLIPKRLLKNLKANIRMRLDIQLKFHQDTLTEKFSFPVNVSSVSLKKVTTVVNFSSLQLLPEPKTLRHFLPGFFMLQNSSFIDTDFSGLSLCRDILSKKQRREKTKKT